MSVPNGCARLGAESRSPAPIWSGAKGASAGANNAASSRISRIAAPMRRLGVTRVAAGSRSLLRKAGSAAPRDHVAWARRAGNAMRAAT